MGADGVHRSWSCEEPEPKSRRQVTYPPHHAPTPLLLLVRVGVGVRVRVSVRVCVGVRVTSSHPLTSLRTFIAYFLTGPPPPLQVTQGFADHSDLLAEAKAAKAKVRK